MIYKLTFQVKLNFLNFTFRSMGGMEVDGSQSVTAWGINVGSKLAQGVSKIYSNIFSATG